MINNNLEMADLPSTQGKNTKLPPLSATAENGISDKPKKRAVKKKKKTTDTTDQLTEGEQPKATPRKKKAASASSTPADGGEATAPKKKKRVVKKAESQDGDPSSARSGASASQGEDVGGSKASLIKSPKEGTPRKKKVKKKVKKATEGQDVGGGGDVFDGTLAADLSAIADDIVTEAVKQDADEEEEQYSKQPYSTASAILRSQPTEKFYIETNSGFKGENKNRFVKRQAEEAAEKAIVREEPKQTTILFAIGTHKVLQTICLFLHGLVAGFAAWHMVMTYVLLHKGTFDFLEHYRPLALIVQCTFYFLLVLCTVSAMDRFDIANPKRGFVLKALTLQNGAISVVIYLAALTLSLVNAAYEDKIHMLEVKPWLWNNTVTAESDLDTFSNLNTARNSLSIVGWFVIALTPVVDRLTDNLRSTDEEDLLGVDVDTNNSRA